MRQKVPKKVKEGEAISAKAWNELIDLIQRNVIDVGQSPGVTQHQTPYGTSLAVQPLMR